jgi:hypothetical protein
MGGRQKLHAQESVVSLEPKAKDGQPCQHPPPLPCDSVLQYLLFPTRDLREAP